MTRFTFIKTLVVSTLLKGNGYAFIERDADGNARALHYIHNTLFNIGVVSCNEIRKEIDLPAVEGGDAHFVQANLLEVKNAASNTPANNNIVNDKKLQDERDKND